ncbi:MAG TPA: GNAT family N-acetyltransferase [Dehalococcoidia bacterium]|nr:GNAT family N-acetyltransferase [Dehalococcoidia bacterium]
MLATCALGAVQIRSGGPTDALGAANVWLRSRRQAIPAIPAPIHTDDEVRAFFGEVVVPNRELYIAESAAGAVVGLMVLDRQWIDNLYLDPYWTGRGIGTCLVELAKRLRPGGLDLWTFQSNVGVRRFYVRLGFVVVEMTDGQRNEERAPGVHYQWAGEE